MCSWVRSTRAAVQGNTVSSSDSDSTWGRSDRQPRLGASVKNWLKGKDEHFRQEYYSVFTQIFKEYTPPPPAHTALQWVHTVAVNLWHGCFSLDFISIIFLKAFHTELCGSCWLWLCMFLVLYGNAWPHCPGALPSWPESNMLWTTKQWEEQEGKYIWR